MNNSRPCEPARFLVIEDDPAFSSILERVLSRQGYEVATAREAANALEVAGSFRPTHAVVDLKLGDSSGLHLIKPLLALNESMKVVVLTGYGSLSTAVEAIKAGAVNYLAKPVDLETLLKAFDEAEPEPAESTEARAMSLRRLEWEHIQRVLDENEGNISATARALGMHRRTLQRKLQKRPVKS